MPKIIIPTPLRPYVGNQEEVQLRKEGSLGEVMTSLIETHAALKQHLYDDAGNLRKFVNIYLNDEDVRYQDGEKTPVKSDDTISIIPSIAGG